MPNETINKLKERNIFEEIKKKAKENQVQKSEDNKQKWQQEIDRIKDEIFGNE